MKARMAALEARIADLESDDVARVVSDFYDTSL